MLEEIEMLKSRTEEILVQLLAQWEQGMIGAPDQALSPFGRVALHLSEASDKLSEAAGAATELFTEDDPFSDDYAETTERRVSVDIEERETKPSRGKKGGSK